MTSRRSLSKVLLYSHDTYGLGHLRRNLVIAGQLLGKAHPPRVVLASGSPVIDQVLRPQGLVCVQLPPVVKTGEDEYRSIEPSLGISLVRRARSAVLVDVVRRWKPDVLLVDHSPQGMKGELLPVFDALPWCSPRTKVVLGLRDIIDEPERVSSTWESDGVYQTLESVYDRIFVYGSRDLFDLATAYRIPEPVASRLEYCGYVTGDRGGHAKRPDGIPPVGEYVLGTVGGGGDGVEVLMATAEASARLGLGSVLCTGPLMTALDRQRLRAHTAPIRGAVVVEHLQDLAAVAAGAHGVVSRGGYNSVCELVSIGAPTIVVPRAWPRHEQVLRARAFGARGLVRVVEEGGHDLVEQLRDALGGIARGTEQPVPRVDLHGRQRVVESLERLVGRSQVLVATQRARSVAVPA